MSLLKMVEQLQGSGIVPFTATEVVARDMRGQFSTAHDARAFMLAGKAIVTLVSKKTGTRFTYRVAQGNNVLFVGLLNGPDNTEDYKYLGRITQEGTFWCGRKTPRVGDIHPGAPSAQAFSWAWAKLAAGVLPETLEIWHEGKCGRCGRRLTVPESIAQGFGFGPECVRHV